MCLLYQIPQRIIKTTFYNTQPNILGKNNTMRLFPKSHFAAANVKKKMKITKKIRPFINLNTLVNKILIFFKNKRFILTNCDKTEITHLLKSA